MTNITGRGTVATVCNDPRMNLGSMENVRWGVI
jgi:hypothetical protein